MIKYFSVITENCFQNLKYVILIINFIWDPLGLYFIEGIDKVSINYFFLISSNFFLYLCKIPTNLLLVGVDMLEVCHKTPSKIHVCTKCGYLCPRETDYKPWWCPLTRGNNIHKNRSILIIDSINLPKSV